MTFVFGMVGTNGLVICTDSLESDTLTKRTVNKLKFFINTNDGWSIAAAGAGPGGKVDKFFSEVRAALPKNEPYKRAQIESVIESTLTRFRNRYPDDPFRIVLGLCANTGYERILYRSDDNYLSPTEDHVHVGVGHSLWRFLSEMLYERGNSVSDNVRLATFIMRQAIKYVDGVDGPIRIATFTYGDNFWTGKSVEELQRIEADFDSEDMKSAMRAYWRRHNPPTQQDQLRKWGGVRTPGDELTLLDGVKLEELYTIAGRKRASKIFLRNTDRLQQRGLLERRRRPPVVSDASRSSGGKTHT